MTEKNLSNIERGLQVPLLNSFLKLLDILDISLSEFGVESRNIENKSRSELIKEIYLSNTQEIEVYLNIVRSIKTLK